MLRSQRTPTTYNYNFAVEYELPHQVVVTAGYVGSRGLFLPFSNVDLNQLSLQQIQNNGFSLVCQFRPWGVRWCLTLGSGESLNPNFIGANTVPLWAVVSSRSLNMAAEPTGRARV